MKDTGKNAHAKPLTQMQIRHATRRMESTARKAVCMLEERLRKRHYELNDQRNQLRAEKFKLLKHPVGGVLIRPAEQVEIAVRNAVNKLMADAHAQGADHIFLDQFQIPAHELINLGGANNRRITQVDVGIANIDIERAEVEKRHSTVKDEIKAVTERAVDELVLGTNGLETLHNFMDKIEKLVATK